MVRGNTSICLALTVLSLLGCGNAGDSASAGVDAELSETSSESRIVLEKPSGPHLVGMMDFVLVDESRDEKFAPGSPRRVPIRAWYPAESVTGSPRPYATDPELELQVKTTMRLLPDPQKATEAFRVVSNSYENAPVKSLGKIPTVVYSHGLGSYPQQNTPLMEHLASHGYLVLSVSHPYSTSAVIYENGEVVLLDPQALLGASVLHLDASLMTTPPDPSVRLEHHLQHAALSPLYQDWIDDVLHVLDRITAANLPENANQLAELIDPARTGTIGMSFGSAAVIAGIQHETVKASVNLDGGIFDESVFDRESRIPLLIFHGDPNVTYRNKKSFPYSEFAFEEFESMGDRDDILRLTVQDTSHGSFQDFTLLPQSLIDEVATQFPDYSLGETNGQEIVDIINVFVKQFFDQHLLRHGPGIDEALLKQHNLVRKLDVAHVKDWMGEKPKPSFMSYWHVMQMNRLLAVDEPTRAAAAKLDRKYVLAYELLNGPSGDTQWWLMHFDPERGVWFELNPSDERPDLTLKGDYSEYMEFIRSLSADEATVEEQPVEFIGMKNLMEDIVGETFEAARKAGVVETKDI